MPTFFFDIKDGITIRDKLGMEFRVTSEAIEHSKVLAERLRREHAHRELDRRVSVIDESGAEIHSEIINRGGTKVK